jgi:UDP-GlcNAc:undecaprenyl-phosphate GlcNAc-1-phosphate transferase
MNGFLTGTAIGLLTAFWGGCLLTGWLLSPMKKALEKAGLVRPNYKGQMIPTGLGSALWLGLFFTVVPFFLLSDIVKMPWPMVQDMIGLLFVATGFFVIGLLDDVAGNREATGIRGHVRKLIREKEVTTGLIKAAAGLLIGIAGAWLIGGEGFELAVQALVIALSANLVNLLDLRPGRACKGVLIALAVLSIVSIRAADSPAFWLMLGIVIAYFPDDVKARVMMGDAGANLLGGGIGYLIASTCSPVVTLLWLGVLVVLHLYAEKYSLSDTIEKNRLLRWLDVLGRSA